MQFPSEKSVFCSIFVADLLIGDDPDVGQVAPLLVVVQTVAHDEVVRDFETAIIDLQVRDALCFWLAQQGGDPHLTGT